MDIKSASAATVSRVGRNAEVSLNRSNRGLIKTDGSVDTQPTKLYGKDTKHIVEQENRNLEIPDGSGTENAGTVTMDHRFGNVAKEAKCQSLDEVEDRSANASSQFYPVITNVKKSLTTDEEGREVSQEREASSSKNKGAEEKSRHQILKPLNGHANTIHPQILEENEETDAKETRSMELNDAYVSLEKMARANLEVEFNGCLHFGESIDFRQCTQCLRASISKTNETKMAKRRFFTGHRVKKLINVLPRNKVKPCLICATLTCPRHRSESFQKEGIIICDECSHLFSLDFIVDCVMLTDNPLEHRKRQVNRLIDVYDRALLLLKYAAQYIDGVACSLERNTKRNNRVGIGSSATGVVSGITGIVAAATILTPAGPPLLIASLLFGGSATAASASSEAVNYLSEPNKLANNIIALHSVVRSLSGLSGILRDAFLRDYIRVDHFLEDANSPPATNLENALEQVQETLEKKSVKLRLDAGAAAVAYTAAVTEIGCLATAAEIGGLTAARSSRLWSRATSNVLKTARLARFTAGALSTVTIALEAREIATTIQRIRAGDPCEKADTIRKVKAEMDDHPDTTVFAKECDRYLVAISNRPAIG